MDYKNMVHGLSLGLGLTKLYNGVVASQLGMVCRKVFFRKD